MRRPSRTKTPFYLVNAFATSPHGGNQAAVVVLDAMDSHVGDEKWMANVARDFDLPMTAFVVPHDENGKHFAIRWFTASGYESHLCGHATLAAAFVLFNRFAADASVLYFDTRFKGVLTAERAMSNAGLGVAISLPIGDFSVDGDDKVGNVIASASGIDPSDILHVATFDDGRSALVEVKDTVPIKDLNVNTAALSPTPAFAAVVTQAVGDNTIQSRVFIPSAGLPEDPVTGSVHAVLTNYYLNGPGAARLGNGSTINALQLSKRGGAMSCEIKDDKVRVVGRAWITASGVLEL